MDAYEARTNENVCILVVMFAFVRWRAGIAISLDQTTVVSLSSLNACVFEIENHRKYCPVSKTRFSNNLAQLNLL